VFKQIGIKCIVRLNESLYDSRTFERNGIKVFDLEFPDGSCPSDSVIKKFMQIVSNFEGQGVAVHCRAGLGRTGTLIGCYII
jgi:cell division cycle 14